jgi:hypothetical protein
MHQHLKNLNRWFTKEETVMATLEQLEYGLRKADEAGNADHAKRFADEIRKMRVAPISETPTEYAAAETEKPGFSGTPRERLTKLRRLKELREKAGTSFTSEQQRAISAASERKKEKWQEIANRGLQDRFDPETRAKFDEAVKRGLITLPADAKPQAMDISGENMKPWERYSNSENHTTEQLQAIADTEGEIKNSKSNNGFSEAQARAIAETEAEMSANNSDSAKTKTEEATSIQVEQKTESPDILSGTLTSIGQGASFGFSDELAGLVQSALPYPYGTDYATATEGARDQQDAFQEEHPLVDFGAQLIGGIATGVGGVGKVAATKAGTAIVNALRNVPQYAKYISTGGGVGGVAGAGYAPEGETLEGAGKGAAGGALLAGVLPPIARGVNYLANKTVVPMINNMRSPMSQALRKIRGYIDDDSLMPEQVMANHKKLGPNATLADSAGENVLAAADAIAQQPGKGRNAIVKMLNERQAGQHGRVKDSLIGAFDDERGFYSAFDNVSAKLKTKSAPIYKKAYETKVLMTDSLKALSDRPSIKSAMNKAMKLAKDEGIDLQKSFIIKKGKVVGIRENPDMQTWDYIKRGLDDVVAKHTDDFGRITNNQGRVVNNLKNELLDELDNINPHYKQARSVYAGDAKNKGALEQGRKFLREDAELSAKRLSNMAQSEKENFRAGAMRAIKDKIDSAPDSADAYKRIFGNKATRDKLRSVFPDDETYEAFAMKMEAESTFYKTNAMITGNSSTARRLNYGDDVNIPASVTRDVRQGNVIGLAETGVNALMKDAAKLSEPVRNYMSQILLNPNQADNMKMLELIKALRQPNTSLLPGYAGTAGVTVTGEQAGALTR